MIEFGESDLVFSDFFHDINSIDEQPEPQLEIEVETQHYDEPEYNDSDPLLAKQKSRRTRSKNVVTNFRCEECGKYFAQKSALTLHSTLHTGEMKFGCQYCGKRFRIKGNMYVHIRQVHENPNPKQKKPKKEPSEIAKEKEEKANRVKKKRGRKPLQQQINEISLSEPPVKKALIKTYGNNNTNNNRKIAVIDDPEEPEPELIDLTLTEEHLYHNQEGTMTFCVDQCNEVSNQLIILKCENNEIEMSKDEDENIYQEVEIKHELHGVNHELIDGGVGVVGCEQEEEDGEAEDESEEEMEETVEHVNKYIQNIVKNENERMNSQPKQIGDDVNQFIENMIAEKSDDNLEEETRRVEVEVEENFHLAHHQHHENNNDENQNLHNKTEEFESNTSNCSNTTKEIKASEYFLINNVVVAENSVILENTHCQTQEGIKDYTVPLKLENNLLQNISIEIQNEMEYENHSINISQNQNDNVEQVNEMQFQIEIEKPEEDGVEEEEEVYQNQEQEQNHHTHTLFENVIEEDNLVNTNDNNNNTKLNENHDDDDDAEEDNIQIYSSSSSDFEKIKNCEDENSSESEIEYIETVKVDRKVRIPPKKYIIRPKRKPPGISAYPIPIRIESFQPLQVQSLNTSNSNSNLNLDYNQQQQQYFKPKTKIKSKAKYKLVKLRSGRYFILKKELKVLLTRLDTSILTNGRCILEPNDDPDIPDDDIDDNIDNENLNQDNVIDQNSTFNENIITTPVENEEGQEEEIENVSINLEEKSQESFYNIIEEKEEETETVDQIKINKMDEINQDQAHSFNLIEKEETETINKIEINKMNELNQDQVQSFNLIEEVDEDEEHSEEQDEEEQSHQSEIIKMDEDENESNHLDTSFQNEEEEPEEGVEKSEDFILEDKGDSFNLISHVDEVAQNSQNQNENEIINILEEEKIESNGVEDEEKEEEVLLKEDETEKITNNSLKSLKVESEGAFEKIESNGVEEEEEEEDLLKEDETEKITNDSLKSLKVESEGAFEKIESNGVEEEEEEEDLLKEDETEKITNNSLKSLKVESEGATEIEIEKLSTITKNPESSLSGSAREFSVINWNNSDPQGVDEFELFATSIIPKLRRIYKKDQKLAGMVQIKIQNLLLEYEFDRDKI